MTVRIKVLHIRSTIGFYGAEKVISLLLPSLKGIGVDAELVCLESDFKDSSKLSVLMMKLQQTVYSFVTKKKFDIKTIKLLNDLVLKNKYIVIHTHDYKSLFYIFSSAKKMNVPVIHHVHGALGNTFSEYLYGLIEKILYHFISCIIVVSQKQLQDISKGIWPMPPIEYLHNGVSIPEILNHDNVGEIINISIVARLTSEKNHVLAIDSIKEIIKTTKAIRLNIYGDGPLLLCLKEYVVSNKLKDYVVFHGYIDNINAIYTNTDLLLITSRTEGFPMTLLEAMSFAIPVVSTHVGEIPDVVKSAQCGIIVPPKVYFVSKAIIGYINSPDKLIRQGENARSYVIKYLTIDSQAESLLKIYTKYSVSQ